ncbi:hypothetical protein SCYAM73S_05001 [Streptomyces cyaneofuscatus]
MTPSRSGSWSTASGLLFSSRSQTFFSAVMRCQKAVVERELKLSVTRRRIGSRAEPSGPSRKDVRVWCPSVR